MVHYEIRNALEEDYPAINELAVEAWQILKDGVRSRPVGWHADSDWKNVQFGRQR